MPDFHRNGLKEEKKNMEDDFIVAKRPVLCSFSESILIMQAE